ILYGVAIFPSSCLLWHSHSWLCSYDLSSSNISHPMPGQTATCPQSLSSYPSNETPLPSPSPSFLAPPLAPSSTLRQSLPAPASDASHTRSAARESAQSTSPDCPPSPSCTQYTRSPLWCTPAAPTPSARARPSRTACANRPRDKHPDSRDPSAASAQDRSPSLLSWRKCPRRFRSA